MFLMFGCAMVFGLEYAYLGFEADLGYLGPADLSDGKRAYECGLLWDNWKRDA